MVGSAHEQTHVRLDVAGGEDVGHGSVIGHLFQWRPHGGAAHGVEIPRQAVEHALHVNMADAHDAHGCVQDGHGDAVLVDGEDFVERSGVELLLRGEAHCHELHGEGDRIGPRSPAVLDGVPPADDEGILGDVRPHLRELAAHAGGHKPGFFVELAAQDLTVNANQIFQIPGEGRARRPNDGHGIAFRRLFESRMRILTQGFGIVDHAFLDGRDVSPTSGRDFVSACRDKCQTLGVGKIATVMGRYYAMDRDNRWERVQLAYDAMVYGEGIQNPDPVDAVAQSYANDVTDEFMEPVVCDPEGTISDNDSIIFFNYRPDRAREITRAIVDPGFDGFQREYFPTTYVCNTEYDASMPNVLVAWPRIPVKNGLGEYLSSMGLTQLRIAETEKYAHVTFFFNGGVEKQYPGEDRVLVPSPKVATYDLQPEMSAREVCDKCIERINSGAYDVIILNFANCDMVGHTGVLQAAVKAVETVDECVGRVVEATLKMGGIAMVTADHGNAEVMLQPDGSPMTAHTTNRVPFILCGAGTELREGRLADIAPTILDVMGLACPPEMDGKTLIVR